MSDDEMYIGSAFEGDDDDSAADDSLFSGDPDFNREEDARLELEGDYGAVRSRRRRRKAKRAKLVEQILLPMTRTVVALGAAGTLTVEPDRDCRLLDLRVIGTVAATGVEDPGIVITGLNVGGSNLFNAAGIFVAANCHPRDRRPGAYNCVLKKVIRASQVITLNVTNVTGAAISVDATLLVKAKVT